VPLENIGGLTNRYFSKFIVGYDRKSNYLKSFAGREFDSPQVHLTSLRMCARMVLSDSRKSEVEMRPMLRN